MRRRRKCCLEGKKNQRGKREREIWIFFRNPRFFSLFLRCFLVSLPVDWLDFSLLSFAFLNFFLGFRDVVEERERERESHNFSNRENSEEREREIDGCGWVKIDLELVGMCVILIWWLMICRALQLITAWTFFSWDFGFFFFVFWVGVDENRGIWWIQLNWWWNFIYLVKWFFFFLFFCCWEENKIYVDDWRLMKDWVKYYSGGMNDCMDYLSPFVLYM